MGFDGNCWVVTDGAAGNEKPALALAESMGARPMIFPLSLRRPWAWLAPHFRNGGRRAIQGPLAQALRGPLPELLITGGRQSTLASTTIKRLSGSRTYTVHLLDPKIDPSHFDQVICPEHDQLVGTNVLSSLGSLNNINDQSLLAARRRWGPKLADFPEPRFVVLIGASNLAYTIDAAMINQIADTVEAWRREYGGSALVSTSRRTPDDLKQLVWQRFGTLGKVWTGADTEGGDNPYLGYLAYADAFVVTPDSVNMCSEAAACGKPLHVPELAANHPKFDRFHRSLRQQGFARRLQVSLDLRATPALRETEALAERVLLSYHEFRQQVA